MLEMIKNILVSLTEEGRSESTAALASGLSLAEQAGAHLTVHAASLRLKPPSAMVARMAAKLVAEENRRLAALAERLASEAQRQAGGILFNRNASSDLVSFNPFMEWSDSDAISQ